MICEKHGMSQPNRAVRWVQGGALSTLTQKVPDAGWRAGTGAVGLGRVERTGTSQRASGRTAWHWSGRAKWEKESRGGWCCCSGNMEGEEGAGEIRILETPEDLWQVPGSPLAHPCFCPFLWPRRWALLAWLKEGVSRRSSRLPGASSCSRG